MITHRTKAPVPIAALRLNEDIRSLDQAFKILRTVDAYNVTDNPDKDELWLIMQKIRMMKLHAEYKLRREYLAPIRKIV